MRENFENFFAAIASILIGLPLGIFVGIICWIKFPFQIYYQARATLALQRIHRAQQQIKQLQDEEKDIWERHIDRMEEKKSYDN